MKPLIVAAALAVSPAGFAHPAYAADTPFGAPVPLSDGLALDPLFDARLRYENVDQPSGDAEALTARLRAGLELVHAPSRLSALVEAEATLALAGRYNAFPFALPGNPQYRPGHATIADPESIGLNRAQVEYRGETLTLTVGRQRIAIDDQRFVGASGWRQNEQTFDAVRAQARFGAFSADAAFAGRQHMVFGSEAGPRRALDGDFALLGAGVRLGGVNVRTFAYLIDYEAPFALPNSSQTYGARVSTAVPLGAGARAALAASYARQQDFGRNPHSYAADYLQGELTLSWKGLSATGGYEKLGADGAAARSFQTPLATLHKFNGWADLFLTTPADGLEDTYVTIAGGIPVRALPGLNASVTYHRFRSDTGARAYGSEWDASLGLRVGKVGLLAKYAAYNADTFAQDRRIAWLQAETAF